MPTPPRIGAHFSTSRGLAAMVHTAVGMRANCAQIFTSSPQQWGGKRYDPADLDAFHAARAETDLAPIVAHDSYLINLASADPALLDKSRRAFAEEIARCGLLRLPAVVMHLGAYKGGTLDEGLARLADSLNQLIPRAEEVGVRIVLETTAGQGTYLGGDFAQFPRLFAQIPLWDRLGICLDTCHVFVAGYDLRDDAGYERMMEEFDRQIGIGRLTVIHMNDTEKALGSHSDRHAQIGHGQLGTAPFRRILHDPRLADVPKILEIPGGDAEYAENVRILWELAG